MMTRDAHAQAAARTVGLLLIVVAGCRQLPPETVQQIEQVRRASDAGNVAECERLAGPIIREHANDPGIAGVLYLRGQCRLRGGRRSAARGDFERALELARDDELRTYLEVQIGNMAFDDARYDQACAHYARAAGGLQESAPTDKVLYQYGVALQRCRRFSEARNQFARLLALFPASSLAADARRKDAWAGDFFAIQCGAFSQPQSARQAARHLQSKGVAARAVQERSPLGRYLVLAGRYRTYSAAQDGLARVRTLQPDAFIVP